MPRIQRPRNARIRAVTEAPPRAKLAWGSSGMRVDGLGMRSGWGPRTIPAPPPRRNPVPTPAPAPQPAARSIDPKQDPRYAQLWGMTQSDLQALRGEIDARKNLMKRDYGVEVDDQGKITGWLDNPASRAAQLQSDYERGLRGTNAAMAAAGLRRSGARDRMVAARDRDYSFGLERLGRELAMGLLGEEGRYAEAARQANLRLGSEAGAAIDRLVAQAPPYTPPSAPVASKPQPGGKTVGKGKNRIGIGGAQLVSPISAQLVKRYRNASPQQRQRIWNSLSAAQRRALRAAIR